MTPKNQPVATNTKNKKLAAWLQANESYILPQWARAVREQGKEKDRILTTQRFQEHHLLSLYEGLIKAAQTGQATILDKLLHKMVFERIQEAYNIDEILLIPQLLRATAHQHAATIETPSQALSILGALDPILDRSISTLVHSFTDFTAGLLNERLAEAEFMARNLLQANKETKRSLMQLHTLYNVSRELGRTVEIEQTLGLIAEHLVAVDKINRCAIWLVGKPQSLFVAVTHGTGAEQLDGLILPLSQSSFISRAFQRQEYQLVQDRLDGRPLQDPLGQHFKMRSALAVPFVSEGQAIGVITVDGLSTAQPFDASTIDMLRSIAEQAAVAIKTARLYKQLTDLNQQLEQRVQQRTEELERAMYELERLDHTKSDFISIAAHELKTPLTLVQGYTNILKDSVELQKPKDKELFQGILTGTTRLKSIIEDMIDMSMIDTQVLTLHLALAAPHRVVQLALREFDEALETRKLTISANNLAQLPYIECDSQRLHQVFVNVIGNAIKYTPNGGYIDISGRLLSGQETNSTDFVEITVADTGIGIDPEHHERIFQKFYQIGSAAHHSSGKTKFKGGGPGLGLTIAQGVIEAHGGRIWVESEGHDEKKCPGSTFYIILPVKASHNLKDERKWGQERNYKPNPSKG